MKIREALSIEGSSKLAILCYGVFSTTELDAAFRSLSQQPMDKDSQIYRLFDQDWPNGVLLRESIASTDTNIAWLACDAMNRMFEAGQCAAAVCMYDGAFGTYDDIFATEIAPQIYGFSLCAGESVVALDSHLLVSDAWKSVIEHCRHRLG